MQCVHILRNNVLLLNLFVLLQRLVEREDNDGADTKHILEEEIHRRTLTNDPVQRLDGVNTSPNIAQTRQEVGTAIRFWMEDLLARDHLQLHRRADQNGCDGITERDDTCHCIIIEELVHRLPITSTQNAETKAPFQMTAQHVGIPNHHQSERRETESTYAMISLAHFYIITFPCRYDSIISLIAR